MLRLRPKEKVTVFLRLISVFTHGSKIFVKTSDSQAFHYFALSCLLHFQSALLSYRTRDLGSCIPVFLSPPVFSFCCVAVELKRPRCAPASALLEIIGDSIFDPFRFGVGGAGIFASVCLPRGHTSFTAGVSFPTPKLSIYCTPSIYDSGPHQLKAPHGTLNLCACFNHVSSNMWCCLPRQTKTV